MEATVEQATSSARPQNIVEQLLEIAQKHDAMDVIGGSTSWRWQEGLITRMPKTKTVAAILTKAFNTEDPNIWLTKIKDGALKTFLKNVYKSSICENVNLAVLVDDIYDSLFLILAMREGGVTEENLIYNFAYFRYAKSFDDEEFHEVPDESTLYSLYRPWALKKIEELRKKFIDIEFSEGSFSIKWQVVSSERHHQNQLEIERLQCKVVGFSSVHDMWRSIYVSLTDDENIRFEKKMLEMFQNLLDEFGARDSDTQFQDKKVRIFNMSTISLPSVSKWGLQ